MKLCIGLFFKGFSFLISLLPRVLHDRMGDMIGLLWFDLLRIRRQVAIANVGIAFPEMSCEERTKLARASLRHMGRTIVEFTLFPFLTKQKIARYFVFENFEIADNALKSGKGALMLTLHLGNGDFATAAMSQMGYPLSLISKEIKARWLNEMWFGMRSKHGTQFISPEKSSFEILRALKRNRLVIFVLDQFMGPPVGVRSKFFGKETGTAAGLAMIAVRTGVPVLPCYTYRRADGVHVARFEEPMPLDDRLNEQNITVLTQAYTDKLESIVRRHPEQWMWIHRRWKEFRE
jgi:KDO2-lipid IV(A) lauroyltransferase